MPDEDLDRLSQGLPPVASGPELPAGTEGPSEMPGDRGALPVQPGDSAAPAVPLAPQDTTPTMAAPVPVPTAPAPTVASVPLGTHAVKGEQTVKTEVPSGQTLEGQRDQARALEAERAGQTKLNEIAEQKAVEAARQADELATRQRQEDADAAAQAQAEAERKAAIAKQRELEWAQLQQDAKQKPPMFGNWNALDTTLGLVSVFGALTSRNGGIGAAANQALGLIDSHVDRAYKQHVDEIQQRYHALAEKDGYNEKLAADARADMQFAQAQRARTYEHLQQYALARQAALGIPAAQAAANVANAKFDMKAADAKVAAGRLADTHVTTTTHFAPGRAGAGGAGGGSAVVDLVKMAENGAKRSEIVAAAAHAGIPEKTWKNQVDLAFSEREKGQAAGEKAKAGEDDRTIQLNDGTDLKLPTARAVPQFVSGYQSKMNAIEKLRQYHADLKENGDVYTPEAVARRERLHDAAVSAVASVTSMGASDHSTHIEAGTLGKTGKYTIPFIGAGAKDGIKGTELVIKDLEDTVQKTVESYRKGSTPTAESKPAAKSFTPGRPKVLNGKTYVEVSPNNWQPQ